MKQERFLKGCYPKGATHYSYTHSAYVRQLGNAWEFYSSGHWWPCTVDPAMCVKNPNI